MVIKIEIVAAIAAATVLADSSGNNGQCIQLQKTFPPDLQDYQGCHDTFT